MTRRNLNPYEFFCKTAQEHKPSCAFAGKSSQDFARWKKQTLPKVLATMGKRPAAVDPNPELIVEWEEDGLIKQRWVLDVQKHLSVVLLLYRPANLAPGEKRPALFCCHGHGAEGKNNVMGIAPTAQLKAGIAPLNYDYGLQMAKAGFVTYAIDFLGFGERDARRKPHNMDHVGQRDPCNVNFLCATLLGTTVMASNCHDGKVATDFVAGQKFVDAKHLGVMGLSFGGTMTTWMALFDPRFQAIDIVCYSGPFYDIAFRSYNVCGSQITPGLLDLVDTPELQGLIAPRPLLVEMGIHETCFEVDYTYKLHYPKLKAIYEAAGAELELDLFPGEHSWSGHKSVDFFRKHLKANW